MWSAPNEKGFSSDSWPFTLPVILCAMRQTVTLYSENKSRNVMYANAEGNNVCCHIFSGDGMEFLYKQLSLSIGYNKTINRSYCPKQ